MKKVFIAPRAKRNFDFEKIKSEIENLPEKNLSICFSSQYMDFARKLSEELEIKTRIQVLGCSDPKFDPEVEAIIFLGEGQFHSVSLAYESGLPVYVVEDSGLRKIKDDDIEKMQKREKGAMLRYLNAEKVGILITSKPGQERINRALDLKKKLKKKSYLFVENNIDPAQFENFGLDFWVNTACPRMDLTGAPIINLTKVEELNSRNRED